MKCPVCMNETKVYDTRCISHGIIVRRRRKCLACGARFTSYEEYNLEQISKVDMKEKEKKKKPRI